MGYELSGSRVLVTGGAGFIGSHIVDHLFAAGASEVVVIDNLIRGSRANLATTRPHGRLTFVQGTITDADLVRRWMHGIDYLYHEAALRITHCAEDPREAHAVMYEGTFNVVEAAVQAGVKKLVAASSASVYGEPSYLPIDEGHPYNNRTLYGAAKIANEHLYRSFNEMENLPYVALRYFNAYGPRMDIHGVYTEVMIRWMDRIAQGLPPIIFGDGTQSMDFVYVRDIAHANILAMQSDVSDEVFNVASGTRTTLNELARMLCAVMGRPELEIEYREERKVNPVRHRLAATERARNRLGFTAATPLSEGLAHLVEWWEGAKQTQEVSA